MTDIEIPQAGLSGVQLHRIDCIDDAMAFKRWLGERRPVLACDTETEGLKPWRDKVRLVQFGDGMTGWTIRWDRWGGIADEVFNTYDGPYVFHNAKYDLQELSFWCDTTIPWGEVHDTAIMARLVNASGPRALKDLATIYIDNKAAVGEVMLEKAMSDNKWTWATIPYEVPIYSIYAAIDTVLTARLFDIMYPQVMQVCPLAYDLERSFAGEVQGMEMRGSRIDAAYTQEAWQSFDQYVRSIEEWCMAAYGIKPGSNQKVIERLASEGVTFVKRTPGGALALDGEVLEGIEHPLAQSVLTRRRVQKLSSTYLSNFLKMSDADDIIRPTMDTMGATTGRMSMELLQTLPRRSENNPLAVTVRNCIVPREGRILMMCDFAQIEMRVLAHLANDPDLIAAFGQGDFFNNAAREIFNDMSISKGDERRQHTKNAFYAKSYGAGVPKFSATAGIPIEQGEAFMNALDARFPGIRRLQGQVHAVAQRRLEIEGRPYVMSPMTRRHFYLKDDDKIYALVNYMIQGTAAEILKMKTVELAHAGIGEYLTLLVHDEVIADVPLEVARDVADTMNRVMNDATLLSVPIEAEVELAHRWGEKGAVSYASLPS